MRRYLLPVALAVAAALVLVLAAQNKKLRERNLTLQQMARDPYPGFIVPTVRAPLLTGDSVTLGETTEKGGRQVLLAFNTSCPFCLASLPAWQTVAAAAQAAATPTRVYGVSLDPLDSTRAYVDRHRITYPVVLLSSKDPLLFRVNKVPSILVLDEYGRTVYARVGALATGEATDSVLGAVTAAPTQTRTGAELTTTSREHPQSRF
jgi:peroxiredoxin